MSRNGPAILRAANAAISLLPALGAGAAWFLASERLLHRAGANDIAFTIAAMVGLAVIISLYMLSRADADVSALDGHRCPRCDSVIAAQHRHERPGTPGHGVQSWDCGRCGYHRVETLTCAGCDS